MTGKETQSPFLRSLHPEGKIGGEQEVDNQSQCIADKQCQVMPDGACQALRGALRSS